MKPSKAVIPLLICFLIVILAVSYLRLLDSYELQTLDYRFKLRPRIPVTDKIALIEIGDDSIGRLGMFPFDRAYHALLVNALSEAGAKAILFDIFFSEPQEHDEDLVKAIKASGRVYLPFAFDIDIKKSRDIVVASGYNAVELNAFAGAAKGMGHINIIPDIDGKFRRIPPTIKYGHEFYPCVSFLMACDYIGIDRKDVRTVPGKYVLLGKDFKIPVDERSCMLVNFSGKWGKAYKHYSYSDILQSYLSRLSGQKPILDLSVFKDKICIIGLTATGTTDLHPSPFETVYPAVGIHMEIFNSILNRHFIARASKALNAAILIFLICLISALTLILKPMKMLLAMIGAVAAFILASILLFDFAGLWIDLFYPIVAMALSYVSFTLYKYISEWKRRLIMENELNIAKKIQESFLPKKLPETSGVEMAATMFTARQVGGDLYDFLEFGREKLGVMIGDVSGKGVPASLFMAMVSGAFKFFATTDSKPKDALRDLNSKLVKESSSNLFVTMFYALFDMKNNRVVFANGGHLPVAYISKGEKLKFLDADEGMPLGMMDGPYSEKDMEIKKGDLFVFYTDGITEAMNARSEMYEKERLAAVIESNRDLSPKKIMEAIEKDVRRFEPKSKQHDDITMIIARIV